MVFIKIFVGVLIYVLFLLVIYDVLFYVNKCLCIFGVWVFLEIKYKRKEFRFGFIVIIRGFWECCYFFGKCYLNIYNCWLYFMEIM